MGEDREKQCDEALGVLRECLQQLEGSCARLDWDLDNVLQSSALEVCPLSRGHRMPEKKLAEHEETCRLRHRGLSKEETLSLPPSSFPFYQSAPAVRSLVMTQSLQADIFRTAFGANYVGRAKAVPASPDRAAAELTVNERCVLHEYVASKLSEGLDAESQVSLLHELQRLEDEIEDHGNSESQADDNRAEPSAAMAMERDFHRRRRTYRGVHTDRRSHTEVLREVIARQMQMLQDLITARRLRAERLEAASGRRQHRREERREEGREKEKRGRESDRRAADHKSAKRERSRDSEDERRERKSQKKKKKKEAKSTKKSKKSKKEKKEKRRKESPLSK